MEPERINLFFAADPKYFQHLCVVLVSLLENGRNRNFRVHVLTDRAEAESVAGILSLQDRYSNVEIVFREIAPADVASFHLSSDTCSYITIQTYYRCLIADLFPELDKAIYLDCDIIVEGDLGELWNIDLGDFYMAGIPSVFSKQKQVWDALCRDVGFSDNDLYVNAGVLLMNLEALRRDHVVEAFLSNAEKLGDVLHFQDQDLINYTLRGRIKPVDRRFNWTTHDSKHAGFHGVPSIDGRRSVVVSHFTNHQKPWNPRHFCKHDARKLYFHYLKSTPYKNRIWAYRLTRPFLVFAHFLENCVEKPLRFLRKLPPGFRLRFSRRAG